MYSELWVWELRTWMQAPQIWENKLLLGLHWSVKKGAQTVSALSFPGGFKVRETTLPALPPPNLETNILYLEESDGSVLSFPSRSFIVLSDTYLVSIYYLPSTSGILWPDKTGMVSVLLEFVVSWRGGPHLIN